MQEQNFEKQVQKKMEELSFTPTDPVWKKIEAEIRIRRDRRRLLFWLPLALLLLGAGVWFISNETNHDIIISKTNNSNEEKDNKGKESQSLEENPIAKEQEKPLSKINEGKDRQQNIETELQKESVHKQIVTRVKKVDQKRKAVATSSRPFTKEFVSVKKKEVKEKNQVQNLSSGESNNLNTSSPGRNIIAEAIPSSDSVTGNIDIEKKETSIDTPNEIIPEIKASEKDSLSVKKIASKKDKSSKWKLAVTAGIGRSGVSNGVGLFGSAGGAKSFETNAFVADQNYNTGQLSSAPNNAYRPPSEQKRSSSFSLGLAVKKKVGKRSALSTGLQYNFYSTEMLVGQNMLRDTAAAPTLRVQQFYANSGASFSEYNNKFHFISLPLAFDFQIIKKLPLDFHIGLSVQQLLKTNALLYSASSQIYYNDNSAFNKTHIFSEVGFMYSLPLKKKGVFQIGPEFNYDHSKMGKENFKQHLFSYGFTTQFVFGSK